MEAVLEPAQPAVPSADRGHQLGKCVDEAGDLLHQRRDQQQPEDPDHAEGEDEHEHGGRHAGEAPDDEELDRRVERHREQDGDEHQRDALPREVAERDRDRDRDDEAERHEDAPDAERRRAGGRGVARDLALGLEERDAPFEPADEFFIDHVRLHRRDRHRFSPSRLRIGLPLAEPRLPRTGGLQAARPSRTRASIASDGRVLEPKIRVVVAKPGLDGHDRGAKIIARALRDAGMEVIYTGLHQTPEQIVETVLQEDADAVGLSILSGAHMTLVPRVVELLREQDAGDVLVTVGGTIPAQDIPELKALGVAEVFTPGAPTADIIEFLRGAITDQLPARAGAPG